MIPKLFQHLVTNLPAIVEIADQAPISYSMMEAISIFVIILGIRYGLEFLGKAVANYMVHNVEPKIAADVIQRKIDDAEYAASKPPSNSVVLKELKSEMAELAKREP